MLANLQLDMLGGVFCTLSLIFKEEFDIVAGVCPVISDFPFEWLLFGDDAGLSDVVPYASSDLFRLIA